MKLHLYGVIATSLLMTNPSFADAPQHFSYPPHLTFKQLHSPSSIHISGNLWEVQEPKQIDPNKPLSAMKEGDKAYFLKCEGYKDDKKIHCDKLPPKMGRKDGHTYSAKIYYDFKNNRYEALSENPFLEN